MKKQFTISIKDIQLAQQRVMPYLTKTPLVRVEWLESYLGVSVPIYLKLENKQITGSFKSRGAFNALLSLTDEERQRGVIARSSGNFAQGVSYASSRLGIKATLVMPTTAPHAKVEGTRSHGAEVILHGTTHKESAALVTSLAQTHGYTILSSFDMDDVICGQGIVGLEILEDLPDVGMVVSPVGGGGLTGGISMAIKETSKDIYVLGVEPETANDFFLSKTAGEVVEIAPPVSIADGLLVPRVGGRNWPVLNAYVDDVALVSEDDILSALVLTVSHMDGMRIEPSGVVSIAGVMARFKRNLLPSSGPIVCVVSGGNVDIEKFPNIFNSTGPINL